MGDWRANVARNRERFGLGDGGLLDLAGGVDLKLHPAGIAFTIAGAGTDNVVTLSWFDAVVGVVLAVLFGALVDGFLKPYLSEKGKNLATKEDMREIVAKVEKVTEATEDIKQEISLEYWNRRRQWEIKRDILLQVTQAMTKLRSALLDMVPHAKHFGGPGGAERAAAERSARKMNLARRGFDRAMPLVEMACGKEVVNACLAYFTCVSQTAGALSKGDQNANKVRAAELAKLREDFFCALRAELGMTVRATP